MEAENSRTKQPPEKTVRKNGALMDDFSKLLEAIDFDIGEEDGNKRKDRPKKGFFGFFKREKGSQLEREEKQ